MKKIALLLILCLSLSVLPLFAETGQSDVVIYLEASEFRTALAEEIQNLAGNELNFTIITEKSEFRRLDYSAYQAIIVINEGQAAQANRAIVKRIRRNASETTYIVVTTYSTPESAKDDYSDLPTVDGITTASLTDSEDISAMARQILEMID